MIHPLLLGRIIVEYHTLNTEALTSRIGRNNSLEFFYESNVLAMDAAKHINKFGSPKKVLHVGGPDSAKQVEQAIKEGRYISSQPVEKGSSRESHPPV